MAGRTEERLERSRARKVDRMMENTCTIPPGPSIMESLILDLDKATHKYLVAKANAAEGWADAGHKAEVALHRGEMRGLARAVARMQNPYHPTRDIKGLERESISRVKEAHGAEAQEEAAE